MPDLNFAVESAEPLPFAAAPHLLFKLRVRDAAPDAPPIHSAVLRCQIRIEPNRRRYHGEEAEELFELFGRPHDWDRTLRSMLWTHVNVAVPGFRGETLVELPAPCSYDFNIAATKYFAAVSEGEAPLCFLFSGTVFYESPSGGLMVSQIPWEKEADFRLPIRVWKQMMASYYPGTVWVGLQQRVFDRINDHKRRHRLTSWEQALESLLPRIEEQVQA